MACERASCSAADILLFRNNHSQLLAMNSIRVKSVLQQSHTQVNTRHMQIQQQQPSIQLSIHIISRRPRYQYLFIGLMCFVWLLITYSAMVGSYVFMNPVFECGGQPTPELVACQEISRCKITNQFTATSYDRLFCEGQGSRSAIQSMFALGAVLGMFGLPALSDVRGRRFSIIFGSLLQILGSILMIIGVYQNIVGFMIVAQIVMGFFTSGMVVVSFVITGQFCEDSMRQTAVMLYCATWGLGEISFYFLYNYMPSWNFYLIFLIFIPSILTALGSVFFILESPEYSLLMKKDLAKFSKTIQKIAQFNQASASQIGSAKKIGQQKLAQIGNETSLKILTLTEIMKKLLKDRASLVACVCISVTQFAYNVFYYGLQGSLQRTGYDFGTSMLLIGAHEFLGYMTASYFIRRIKRKSGLIVSIVITSGLGLTFLLGFVADSLVLQSIVISLIRIGSVYCYSFISIMLTESFPNEIKSTANGLSNGLAHLSRIGVPYLITAMNDRGIHPLIAASAFFLLLGVIPLGPVKQTWGKFNQIAADYSALGESQDHQRQIRE